MNSKQSKFAIKGFLVNYSMSMFPMRRNPVEVFQLVKQSSDTGHFATQIEREHTIETHQNINSQQFDAKVAD